MKIDTSALRSFYLKDLYEIRMGNGFDKNKLDEDSSGVNFVSRISYNNGVDVKVGSVDGIIPFDAGFVTVALGGSYLGSCFVQEEPFYTAQNVAVMAAKTKKMTKYVNLFITGLVRYESRIKYYAFGRELNTHIRTDFDVKLPIQHNSDGTPFIDESKKFSSEGYVPDWTFMENYIRSLHYKPLTTKNKRGQALSLKINEWKDFQVGKIFTIRNGKGITQEDLALQQGTFPAVQSAGDTHGVVGTRDWEDGASRGAGEGGGACLTVARSGSAGFISFQIDGCVVGDSAKILSLPDDIATTEIYLFLQTILSANRFKYDYGRKITTEKYLCEWLSLPIRSNDDGTPFIDESKIFSSEGYVPDWTFMENYIRALPYGDRLNG